MNNVLGTDFYYGNGYPVRGNKSLGYTYIDLNARNRLSPIMVILICLIGWIMYGAIFNTLYGTINGQPLADFTFQGLLEMLSNLEIFKANLMWPNFEIVADWGLFNFFREFINLIITAVEFVYYIAKCGYTIITSISQFIIYLYGLAF